MEILETEKQYLQLYIFKHYIKLRQSCKNKPGIRIGAYVTECTVCVLGHDPLTFSFLSFVFFDWVGILWPQLSKVLKLVRWASSIHFPPVSLQRLAVCLLWQPVFMCSSQGRAYIVS